MLHEPARHDEAPMNLVCMLNRFNIMWKNGSKHFIFWYLDWFPVFQNICQ